jgi:sterol 3beta-glucosyltransferase
MKITIFAAGSRGDIQPCVALSRGLQQAGYQVRLAAPQDFAAFVRAHDADFYPLRGDVQQAMASDTGRRFLETGGANPFQAMRAMRALIAPIALQMAEDANAACRDADAILCLGVLAAFGATIAQARGLPLLLLEPTPLLPTRAFPAPGWPLQRSLGGWLNRLSGAVMLRVLWSWYAPGVNAFRTRLGLPGASAASFTHTLRSTPLIAAYSPVLIPPPRDWPEHVHVTGYLFLDERTTWQPSPDLLAFLEGGPPPVSIGFGSMAGRDPAQLAHLAIEALVRCGQRGLLLTGWGGLRAEAVPNTVYVVDAAPHNWLFPHMAAVVHHGGAGTTAEGLRAGVPTVIAPFAFDQFFWGARVQALGLGSAPIPHKQLTTARLAGAIHRAVTDPDIRQRARACGQSIRAEDGVGRAVAVVNHYLSKATPGKKAQNR